MKNTSTTIFILIIIFQFLLSGCYNDFDPLIEGTYDTIVAFSMLDNRERNQYAFAQKIYQHLNERKNFTNLEFWLSEKNGNVYKFRDTTIEDDYFKIYYLPDFKFKRGITYQFSVIRDSVVKDNASIDMPPYPMSHCYMKYLEDEWLPAEGYLYFRKDFVSSKSNFYFKFKAFVEFEKTENGKTKTIYQELPYGATLQYLIGDYPSWKQLNGTWRAEGSSEFTKTKIDSFTFDGNSVGYALQLFNFNERYNVTVKRAFVIAYTVDEYYYDHHMDIKWDEQISSRFDIRRYSPDVFTQNEKIVGVFGAVTADTLDMPIDKRILDRWGYIDGQKH